MHTHMQKNKKKSDGETELWKLEKGTKRETLRNKENQTDNYERERK